MGATATQPGSRPTGRAAEGVSPVPASIPSADALVRLLSAWGELPAHKFHKAYPFFEADRQRTIAEYDLCNDDRANLEATALLFSDYASGIYWSASAIEARRAATTQIGAVEDESAPGRPNDVSVKPLEEG